MMDQKPVKLLTAVFSIKAFINVTNSYFFIDSQATIKALISANIRSKIYGTKWNFAGY